jgi:hypothetical protein
MAEILLSAAALGAIAAGTQTASSGTVVFSNSNGITFGMSNSSVVTASYVPGAGASVNFSAGTTSNNLSAVTFSNSNGVSFGLNGSTITASIASVATSLTNINISAGTTSNNLSAVTFGNSNGISFGLNASTVTASVAGTVGTVSCFSHDADFVTNFTASQAVLSMQKLSIPMNLQATQLAIIANFAGNSASSGAITVSHAVYTLSGGTASLASSASAQFSWTSGSATTASSQFGGASGTRYRTMGVNYSMTPGDYLFAWHFSTSGGATCVVFGRAAMNLVGAYNGIDTNYFLNGTSVSTIDALPASIAATNTNYARTGLSPMQQPGVILVGTH